jgi:putative Holliday junction resolvase
MGRILGIDPGDVRMGIALSDETAFLASALCTVENTRAGLTKIVELATEHNVQTIVVGLPRNMDGSYGPSAEKVRCFIEKLRTASAVPVVEWDERLSTVSAHNVLREAGLNGKRRKGVVDQVAAQIILQHYLDSQT